MYVQHPLSRPFDVHQNPEFVQCFKCVVADCIHHQLSTRCYQCVRHHAFGNQHQFEEGHCRYNAFGQEAISIRTVHIQQQMGGSDCGLFTIANATALCYGKDLRTLVFDQKLMREHPRKCFVARVLTEFPCRDVERRIHN